MFRYLTIFAQSQNIPKRSPLYPLNIFAFWSVFANLVILEFLDSYFKFFGWKQIQINDLDFYFSNKAYFSLFWPFSKDVLNEKVNLRSFPDNLKQIISIQNTENYLLIVHKKNSQVQCLVKKNFINKLISQKSGQVKRVSNFF